MNDKDVLDRINELAGEEHELFQRESSGDASDAERERLRRVGVTLDQCWDLLRQRRAKRSAGQNPDDAEVRDETDGRAIPQLRCIAGYRHGGISR